MRKSVRMGYSRLGLTSFKIFRGDQRGGSHNINQQESPPAWTQEAYRPPCGHSNFLLFPGWGGGGSLDKKIFSSLNMYQAKSGVKNFSLYWEGGGGPLTKIFFSSLNMYQAKSGVKNFSLYWGGSLDKKFFPLLGGVPRQKFFFWSEHVSSQIWCQKFFNKKFFSLYWWGGESLDKNFFSSLNMYQAKSGVKNFSLYWGGSLDKKFFFRSEHVSSQIWCQKFFPLLGGGSLDKTKFSSLNMYQAKSGVKNFSLYWGRGPLTKIFFSSLNMYQAKSGVKNFSTKNFFPFNWGGESLNKNFFFQSEHVSSQIWCQKFFPLIGGGSPSTKTFFSSLNMYQAKSGVKNFSL